MTRATAMPWLIGRYRQDVVSPRGFVFLKTPDGQFVSRAADVFIAEMHPASRAYYSRTELTAMPDDMRRAHFPKG